MKRLKDMSVDELKQEVAALKAEGAPYELVSAYANAAADELDRRIAVNNKILEENKRHLDELDKVEKMVETDPVGAEKLLKAYKRKAMRRAKRGR